MNDQSLAGRKALVTGGARGIGAEIATALAKAGASVMIGDILLDLARETAGGIAKLGVTAGATKLDVTDDNQWEQAVGATISTLGGFDILINNAGIEITVARRRYQIRRRRCACATSTSSARRWA